MLQLDHLLIAVNDLDTAMNTFSTLGFTVRFGGVHTSGATQNALIVFADGTYLELLAPTGEPAKPNTPDYTFMFARGEGFTGFCLSSDDLPADAQVIRERGGNIGAISEGGRVRGDGTAMRWRAAWIDEQSLPFVMEDLTPRVLRVTDDPDVTTHPNGATGIAAVVVTDSPWAMPVALNQRFTAVFGESDERGVYRCGHVEIWMTPPGGTHDAVTSVRLRGLTQPLVAHNVIIEPA